MPDKAKTTLNPDFDPSYSGNLPDVPDDVAEMKRRDVKKRRLVSLVIVASFALIIIGLLIWSTKVNNNEYHYIKFVSAYTASEKDIFPGADLEAVEIKIGNLSFYADKVEETSLDKKSAEKILGEPDADLQDFAFLKNEGDYITVYFKNDLADPNINKLIIHENTSNNLKEAYNVFISSSKNGPWDYLGKKAGTVEIDLQKYLAK